MSRNNLSGGRQGRYQQTGGGILRIDPWPFIAPVQKGSLSIWQRLTAQPASKTSQSLEAGNASSRRSIDFRVIKPNGVPPGLFGLIHRFVSPLEDFFLAGFITNEEGNAETHGALVFDRFLVFARGLDGQ